MNKLAHKIKRHPKKFIIVLVASIIYLVVYRIWEVEDWRLLLVLLLLYFTFIWILFSRSVDDIELTATLDIETKKLNVRLERVYQLTGYNRYEVYVDQEGKYTYCMSDHKKKQLLKYLRQINQ